MQEEFIKAARIAIAAGDEACKDAFEQVRMYANIMNPVIQQNPEFLLKDGFELFAPEQTHNYHHFYHFAKLEGEQHLLKRVHDFYCDVSTPKYNVKLVSVADPNSLSVVQDMGKHKNRYDVLIDGEEAVHYFEHVDTPYSTNERRRMFVIDMLGDMGYKIKVDERMLRKPIMALKITDSPDDIMEGARLARSVKDLDMKLHNDETLRTAEEFFRSGLTNIDNILDIENVARRNVEELEHVFMSYVTGRGISPDEAKILMKRYNV